MLKIGHTFFLFFVVCTFAQKNHAKHSHVPFIKQKLITPDTPKYIDSRLLGIIYCGISVYCARKACNAYSNLQESFQIKSLAASSFSLLRSCIYTTEKKEYAYSISQLILCMLGLGIVSGIFGIMGIKLLVKANSNNTKSNICKANRKKFTIHLQ